MNLFLCIVVCKVNAAIATQLMLSLFDINEVIMIGVAGGIHESVSLYDVVISDRLAYHDVSDDILTEYHAWMEKPYFIADQNLLDKFESITDSEIHIGLIVTGESFIEDAGREEIIARFNPLAVDMESASIAHVCYANDVPFVSVRAISDSQEHKGHSVFEDTVKMASKKAVSILLAYLST